MAKLEFTQEAIDRMTDIWLRSSSRVRRQITAAAARAERVLRSPAGPTVGTPRPAPRFPNARAVRDYPLVTCFSYFAPRDTIYVIDYLSDAPLSGTP